MKFVDFNVNWKDPETYLVIASLVITAVGLGYIYYLNINYYVT